MTPRRSRGCILCIFIWTFTSGSFREEEERCWHRGPTQKIRASVNGQKKTRRDFLGCGMWLPTTDPMYLFENPLKCCPIYKLRPTTLAEWNTAADWPPLLASPSVQLLRIYSCEPNHKFKRPRRNLPARMQATVATPQVKTECFQLDGPRGETLQSVLEEPLILQLIIVCI